ncbi:hypothetical protein [Candidatus Protochlamydia phocaeensis]|uniref:hypothetical protein n=1 Tax=Candidatus Protochlamydia phocaeensis TaxID=1414722 RepID=UPI000838385E|nr:hypothetical protein [Candidatus Protochlamydia phocaeensis]
MDEMLENLWICPLCSAEHAEPVIVCRRCECQLLLLNKIKLTAIQLRQAGYPELSQRFFDKENEIN